VGGRLFARPRTCPRPWAAVRPPGADFHISTERTVEAWMPKKKAVRHGWRTHLRGISPNFGKRRKAVYAKGVRAFLARVSAICHLTAETDSPLCGSLISAARRLDLRRFWPKLVVQYLGLTVRADRRESLLRKPGFIACQCNRLRIGRCDLSGD